MEVVIDNLEDLKKYIKVKKDKKEIFIKFEDVVFNCALPNKETFHYFQEGSVQDYTITIKARNITFMHSAECDNIYANNVTSKETIICKLLNVIGDTYGAYIETDVFIGYNVEVNSFITKKICCNKIKSAYLSIDNEDYFYLKASSINNIGV